MESKRKVLQKLFLSTLYLSAFTFGGGYVIVTLMKKKFVDEYHWIEENEMLDLVAIAQSSPGPIAVNGAIVVGYKLAGMIGVLVSIIGTIIPPFLIISVISVCYQAFRDNFFVSQMLEGMQAGVGAVIASVTYEMGAGVVKEKDPLSLVILVCAFAAACFFGINVIYIVLVCGAIGALRTVLAKGGRIRMMVLFLVFFQIGLFSVGGGYAAMPLIQSLVVESHGWLTMAEFTNLMTIAEMTPGPIAVNSATFVGMRCAGLPGALVATFGCIMPSLILVTLLSYLYGRFRSGQTMQNVLGALRPVVVALIASAALSIVQVAAVKSGGGVSIVGIVLMVAAFLVLRWKKWNPILVMLLCGVGGAAAHAFGWL